MSEKARAGPAGSEEPRGAAGSKEPVPGGLHPHRLGTWRLSLHLRVCKGGSRDSGPAKPRVEMTQCLVRKGLSGTLRAGAGVPRGEVPGAAGGGAGSRLVSGARPVSTRPARGRQRTAPRGAAWSRGPGARLASVQPIRGRCRQRPRRLAAAGRPRERAGLAFVLSSAAQRLPPPQSPEPGARARSPVCAAGEPLGGCGLRPMPLAGGLPGPRLFSLPPADLAHTQKKESTA